MFHAKNAPVFNAACSIFKSKKLLFMTKAHMKRVGYVTMVFEYK